MAAKVKDLVLVMQIFKRAFKLLGDLRFRSKYTYHDGRAFKLGQTKAIAFFASYETFSPELSKASSQLPCRSANNHESH